MALVVKDYKENEPKIGVPGLDSAQIELLEEIRKHEELNSGRTE